MTNFNLTLWLTLTSYQGDKEFSSVINHVELLFYCKILWKKMLFLFGLVLQNKNGCNYKFTADRVRQDCKKYIFILLARFHSCFCKRLKKNCKLQNIVNYVTGAMKQSNQLKAALLAGPTIIGWSWSL